MVKVERLQGSEVHSPCKYHGHFLALPWMPAHQKVGISQEVEDSWSPSQWAVLQVWTYSEAQHPVHPST